MTQVHHQTQKTDMSPPGLQRHHLDTHIFLSNDLHQSMKAFRHMTWLFIVMWPTVYVLFMAVCPIFRPPFIFTARWIYEWCLHSGYL